MKNHFTLICLLAACAPAALPGRAADKPTTAIAADLFPAPVLVKGKGFEVKRSDLDEAVANVKADAIANGQELPPDRMPVVETKLLDHLTQVQLLKLKATDADRAKAKLESDRRNALIKKQFPNDEALLKQLKARGMTLEKFNGRLADEALFETMLRAKISVTEAQLQKYYTDHPSKFEEAEMVRASHIMLRTKDGRTGTEVTAEEKQAKKKQIEDLLKRARAGEDFAKLARQYSEDPTAKDNGGEYKFPRGALGLPEFDAAAFSLQTNQVSDVVTTQYGYHIIKLSEKIPAHHVELAKVSDELRVFLERNEIEKMLPGYYVELKKEAGVEFVDEKYKALEQQVAELSAKAASEAAQVINTPEKAK